MLLTALVCSTQAQDMTHFPQETQDEQTFMVVVAVAGQNPEWMAFMVRGTISRDLLKTKLGISNCNEI